MTQEKMNNRLYMRRSAICDECLERKMAPLFSMCDLYIMHGVHVHPDHLHKECVFFMEHMLACDEENDDRQIDS